MRKKSRTRVLAVAFVFYAALQFSGAGPTHGMCVPVPCPDCWVQSTGQLNLVVIDEDSGRVRLIPNIRVQGESAQFALVVPTPTLPALSQAPVGIWSEAMALTAPVSSRRSGDETGLNCGDTVETPVFAEGSANDGDGVIVHSQQTVGAFIATIVSSEDPEALTRWFEENRFAIGTSDIARITPLIERGWFFTAMKLDTTQVGTHMPEGGWDTNVEPVMFDYEAEELEVPLHFLSINRSNWMPLVFYVVDDHRMTLPGFDTAYANKLSGEEFHALADRYPALSGYLEAGRFLTRLDRTFSQSTPMDGSILLRRAETDEEFRRIGWGIWFGSIWGSLPGQVFGLILLLHLATTLGSAFRTRF